MKFQTNFETRQDITTNINHSHWPSLGSTKFHLLFCSPQIEDNISQKAIIIIIISTQIVNIFFYRSGKYHFYFIFYITLSPLILLSHCQCPAICSYRNVSLKSGNGVSFTGCLWIMRNNMVKRFTLIQNGYRIDQWLYKRMYNKMNKNLKVNIL